VAHNEDQRPLITRYLLGELSEEEQSEFEESYFADDELFAFLLVVEADLVERYMNGELGEKERENFERYFLRSDERRKRVEIVSRRMQSLKEG